MSTPPIFPLPEMGELARPSSIPRGVGRISYAAYGPKRPVNCEDCLRCSLEANRAGRNYPAARKARVKRTQGGVVDLPCYGHRDMRKADEARELAGTELVVGGA